MAGYDWLYALPVLGVDKPNGDDWFRLGWRSIKGGTWNLYAHRLYSRSMCACHMLGARLYCGGVHNGWGRDWSRVDIMLGLWWWEVNFFIIWRISVHKDGPLDVKKRRPLDVSALPQENEKDGV